MTELRTPRFGDIIENGWASERNPTRTGYFVREGRRTGRMNPGRYFEVTDGAGKFWELPVDRDHKITVRPVADRIAALEEALKPFAEVGATVPACWSDFRRLEVVDAVTDASDFIAADLRAAAAALASSVPAGDVERG